MAYTLLLFFSFSLLIGYGHLQNNSSTATTIESGSVSDAISGSTLIVSTSTTTAASTKTTATTTTTVTTTTAATTVATTPMMKIDHSCTEEEKKFIYTPCDDHDNRWRVQVPKKANCYIKYPSSPQPGIRCSYSCKPGKYLDIKSQQCQPCPSGTYSVGDGKRFSQWNQLPEGFETSGYDGHQMTSEQVPLDSPKDNDRCKDAGWTTRGNYLESNGSSCRSLLKYTVLLPKNGNISFDVRSGDESSFFHVWVENDKSCSRTDYYSNEKINQYISVTNEWKFHTLSLSKGRNTIYFLAAFFSSSYEAPGSSEDSSFDSDIEKTVMINNILVRGFASAYNCDVCEAGTYSAPGSSSCVSCPENTYSKKEARNCIMCRSEEYSSSRSDHCIQRKPCSESDYYMAWEPCHNGKTRKVFQWKEPHICSTTLKDSVKLPQASSDLDCPACNPGQYNNGTSCVFCPKDHYSSGTGDCMMCPPRTRGAPGLFYKFWTRFPTGPMHLYCIAKPANGCRTEKGWMIHDEYIDSGVGHADDAELLMYLTIPEFTKETSEFKMTFDIICPADKCRFRIQTIDAGQSVHLIRTYEGNTEKTTFRHVRHSTAPTRYRLVFEKKYQVNQQTYYYSDARIKIYSIDVTNVKRGGTAKCEPCASDGQDCINCPAGSYIGGGECIQCPKNTYLFNKDNPVGIESCKPCPYGTVSDPGSTMCHSDCHMYVAGDRHYNFSALAGLHVLKGQKRFTTKGYLYYHQFNINFCGNPFNESECSNQNTAAGSGYSVRSAICRSTVIPDEKDRISAQSVSIGKVLQSVTTVVKAAAKDNSSSIKPSITDEIIFKFHSSRITEVCKNGTYGIVRLVCDPIQGGKGKVEFGDGKSCHSETCDGCNYVFTMRSKYACPKCASSDYEVIDTACVGSVKRTHYVWKQPHVCFDHGIKPSDTQSECTIFEKSILDFKVIILAFLVGAILLGIIVLYLCYRNRSLSYKYHRLVDSSYAKEGELPPSDRCALEEGEEEDDHIVLARDKGKSNIIDRIKGMRKKRKEFSEFETINLDSMQGYSDDDEI